LEQVSKPRQADIWRAHYEGSKAQGSLVGMITALSQVLLFDPSAEDASDKLDPLLASCNRVDVRDRFLRECELLEPGVAADYRDILSWVEKTHGTGEPQLDFVLCVTLKNLLAKSHNPLVASGIAILGNHFGSRSCQRFFKCPYPRILVEDQSITISLGATKIHYGNHGDHLRRHLQAFFLYEPGILRWIATMSPQDKFLDIGANIGKYSIFAAKLRGCRTFSVEPFEVNHRALADNVSMNGLEGRVTPLRLAVWDKSVDGRLRFDGSHAGVSAQTFDDGGGADSGGGDGEGGGAQPVRAARIDDLIADGTIPAPTHIKIDVDGEEWRLIDGMPALLASDTLKSLRIEMRASAANQAAVAKLEAAGFRGRIDDDAKNVLFRRDA